MVWDHVLVRDPRGQEEDLQLRRDLYSGQELRARLESVGLGDVRLYGDLTGHEYGVNAERLIAAGRKPGGDPRINVTPLAVESLPSTGKRYQ